MFTKEAIDNKINTIIADLKNSQNQDGSWSFCFEGGLMTDAFMIITLRSLNIESDHEEKLIKKLADRIFELQTSDGTWKAYPDEKSGNLSATVQAYCALLYSGFYSQEHPLLRKAEDFIKKNGGPNQTHFMTKWMLAVNGLYQWPSIFYIPMTFLLIPYAFPLNFYQLSTYARIHFIPMMIVANKKFTIKSKHTPNIEHLFVSSQNRAAESWDLTTYTRSQSNPLVNELNRLLKLPSYLHHLGYQRAQTYMLKRIEDDGTLYSYASSTFFMIYSLLSLGYTKQSPLIKNAIDGLKGLVNTDCNGLHLENSTSTVWDTALISSALQEVSRNETQVINKSITYLLSKQHIKKGDWKIHNPTIPPGGWGFSDNNTINPDNDDTSAALRALTHQAQLKEKSQKAWYKGVTYLLSMQNNDGGWAAFEKNTDFKLLTYIPLDNAKDAAIDPSTPDLTGRTLEFLGNYAGMTLKNPNIKAAVNWLLTNQEENGSWYGRWGVCYIYGTWAAITGLLAVGLPSSTPAIKKAISFLESVQLQNGGWGESCKSSEIKSYVSLEFSTPSQTSWALDALIMAKRAHSDSVIRGITHLLDQGSFSKDSKTYPTGIGLPGQFYITYHSYNYIFPLLTLSHFKRAIEKHPRSRAYQKDK
ncbi:squalene--hopene cyclase [Metabacillus litoralis]|uniref:Squalene--hopene cyclase n=1 Tax=Metabacillus litoralis TaxID=152268 RepID=A0A5C6W9H5_9BACI|nr:prenyltransferase/squalene oxidase repeat-containing protein [Metabacillus litoralis]TXC93140.1 squalene--hopene cyclase [Metabacillus litoralis]